MYLIYERSKLNSRKNIRTQSGQNTDRNKNSFQLKVTDLNKYRYKCFSLATGKRKSTVLRSLPPTLAAAQKHSKRVYLQIHTWLSNEQQVTEWGWKKTSNGITPIPTSLPSARPYLLSMIFSSCKESKNGKTACTVGLFSTMVCTNYLDISCSNKLGVVILT